MTRGVPSKQTDRESTITYNVLTKKLACITCENKVLRPQREQ